MRSIPKTVAVTSGLYVISYDLRWMNFYDGTRAVVTRNVLFVHIFF